MNLLKWNTGGSAIRKVCATGGGKFAKRDVSGINSVDRK
jgi:hypothetical protein